MRKRFNGKLNKVMTLCITAVLVFSANITFAFAEAEPVSSASQEQVAGGVFVPPQRQEKKVFLHVNQVVRNPEGTKLYDSDGYSFFIRPSNDSNKYPSFGSSEGKDCKITTDENASAITPELTFTDEWFDKNVQEGQESIVLTYDVSQVRMDENEEIIQDDQTAKAVVTVSKNKESGELVVEQNYLFRTYEGNNVESTSAAFFTNVVTKEKAENVSYVEVPKDADDEDIYGEITYSDDQVNTGDTATVVLWYIVMCLCYVDFLLIMKSRKAKNGR